MSDEKTLNRRFEEPIANANQAAVTMSVAETAAQLRIDIDAISVLANQLRQDLVDALIIKGSS